MLQKLIGTGSFAKVFKGIDTRSTEPVAIKMISKDNLDAQKLAAIEKEISILRLLQHPNIVQIKDIKKTQKNIYLIMEYCHLGDLDSYIEKYYYDRTLKLYHVPEGVVRKILEQLFNGIRKMRENNIVHRDLKLANILVSKDFTVKIADFGFARFQADQQTLLQSYCGTPITMAPEILRKQVYNEKCDIWSLGVIIYKMLVGKYPYFPQGGGLEDLLMEIEKKSFAFPQNIKISDDMKRVICRMLEKDIGKRVGFEELLGRSWIEEERKIEEGLGLKEALLSVYEKSMGIAKKKEKEKDVDGKLKGLKEEFQEEMKLKDCESKVEEGNENKLEIQQEAGVKEGAGLKQIQVKNEEKNGQENQVKNGENEQSILGKEKTIEQQENKTIMEVLPLKVEEKAKEHPEGTGNNKEKIEQAKQSKEIEKESKPELQLENAFKSYISERFAGELSSFQSIHSISKSFLESENSINKLFGYLLLMNLAKKLKDLLILPILLNNDAYMGLSENFQREYKDFKVIFIRISQEIMEKTMEFSGVFNENWQELLETLYLTLCEQNLVNEYLLDANSLHKMYQDFIKIADFLKKGTLRGLLGGVDGFRVNYGEINKGIEELENLIMARMSLFQSVQ